METAEEEHDSAKWDTVGSRHWQWTADVGFRAETVLGIWVSCYNKRQRQRVCLFRCAGEFLVNSPRWQTAEVKQSGSLEESLLKIHPCKWASQSVERSHVEIFISNSWISGDGHFSPLFTAFCSKQMLCATWRGAALPGHFPRRLHPPPGETSAR